MRRSAGVTERPARPAARGPAPGVNGRLAVRGRSRAQAVSPSHRPAARVGVPSPGYARPMRISVSSDMDEPVARSLVAELRDRGHEVTAHGALDPGDDARWAVCSRAAAAEVAAGTADQAVVCCWTGTGASIAANKVPGVRA